MGGRSVYLHVLIAIVFIAIIIVVTYVVYKRKINAMHNNLFDEIKEELNNIIQIYYKQDSFYDIYAETTYARYYFKIVTNTNDKILHIDRNYNFYLLNKPTEKRKNRLDLDDFLNLSPSNKDKRVNKLLILYPNVIEKVYYKSNVEARFVYTDSEFKGVRIINFDELSSFLKNQEV